MKIIHDSINAIFSILGKQIYDTAINYRTSFFSMKILIDDGMLLYNSLTGELVFLNNHEKRLIEENSDIKNKLVNKWFLVPEEFDEKKQCDQIRTITKLLNQKNKNIVHYTIFTTTVCNARCFYCFEIGQKKISMNTRTALDVAGWIMDHYDGRKVFIRWFGGEPLCNCAAIDTICDTLDSNKVKFQSTIVTNAYLFDEEMIKKAINLWNLQKATISLDGTENVYNQTKSYIGEVSNPYRKVIQNIENLLKAGISVTIRLNMDAENAADLEELSCKLGEYYKGYTNLGVRCEILEEHSGKIHHFINNYVAYENRERINRILETKGIKQRKLIGNKPVLNACMADDPRSVTILPDGRIGRCEHYGDSHEIGSIYSNIINKEEFDAWMELWPPQSKCAFCAYYPQCFRLKKCSNFDERCDDIYQIIKINELKEKVLNTYYKWKSKEEVL